MSFMDMWYVTVDDDHVELHAPGTNYWFKKEDFLKLQHKINSINLFENEEWFIQDDTIISRSTGEQLIGVIDDCTKLNELHDENQKLHEENKQLKQDVKQLLQENTAIKRLEKVIGAEE